MHQVNHPLLQEADERYEADDNIAAEALYRRVLLEAGPEPRIQGRWLHSSRHAALQFTTGFLRAHPESQMAHRLHIGVLLACKEYVSAVNAVGTALDNREIDVEAVFRLRLQRLTALCSHWRRDAEACSILVADFEFLWKESTALPRPRRMQRALIRVLLRTQGVGAVGPLENVASFLESEESPWLPVVLAHSETVRAFRDVGDDEENHEGDPMAHSRSMPGGD